MSSYLMPKDSWNEEVLTKGKSLEKNKCKMNLFYSVSMKLLQFFSWIIKNFTQVL